MLKNIIITIISLALLLFVLFFFLKKENVIIQEKQVIVRDTIIIHDTIYQTKFTNVNGRREKRGNIKEINQKNTNENPYKDADLTFKIIPSENNTYGYDILISGRLMVHQPNVPGFPGNEGFKNETNARKVADLVMKKIHNNKMPPSVTFEELKKLNVLR